MKTEKNKQLNIAGKDLVPIMKEQINSGKTVTFSPKGTSMLPLIRQGRDSVTLEKITRPLKRHDIVFYQRDNGQYVLHRIVKIGETITCVGDNQFTLEKGLRHDQMFAVVSAYLRDGKAHSINNFPYRVYCVLLYSLRPFRRFFYKVRRRLKLTK